MKNKIIFSLSFGFAATLAAIVIGVASQLLGRFHQYIDAPNQLYCYGPTLAALVFIAIIKMDRVSSLSLKMIKPIYFAAPILIVGSYYAACLFIQFLIAAQFSGPRLGQSVMYGIEFDPVLYIVLMFVLLTLYSGLGEEMGWRGYLFSKLIGLPWTYLLIIMSVTWACWHIPLFILGNYKNSSILSFLIFMIFCFETSIVLVYLRLKSESVVPCVLFHGSVNFFGWVSALWLPPTSYFTSFPNPVHIVVWLPFAVFYFRAGKKGYEKSVSEGPNAAQNPALPGRG